MNGKFCATTISCTTSGFCEHKNGWYDTVEFGPFKREIFFCTDCNRALYGQKLKDWKAER